MSTTLVWVQCLPPWDESNNRNFNFGDITMTQKTRYVTIIVNNYSHT